MSKQLSQALAPGLQQSQSAAHPEHGALQVHEHNFSGPWFNSKTAAAYVGNVSVTAFYEWVRRRGTAIVPRRGAVARWAKADLDRAMKIGRRQHVMAEASLANLRKRRA